MFALHHERPAPAWQAGAPCDEFRAIGTELQLIDAVDALERAEAAHSPDQAVLAERVRQLQDELVALS